MLHKLLKYTQQVCLFILKTTIRCNSAIVIQSFVDLISMIKSLSHLVSCCGNSYKVLKPENLFMVNVTSSVAKIF